MLQDEVPLSLFDVSTRLGLSPSAIKKRVAQLNLPVQRGPRGKLIFDRHAFALLMQADELLKAGHGFEECRRRLGLEAPKRPGMIVISAVQAAENGLATLDGDDDEQAPDEIALAGTRLDAAVASLAQPRASEPAESADAKVADFAAGGPALAPELPAKTSGGSRIDADPAAASASASGRATDGDPRTRQLPPPVFIQLGRNKRAAVPPDLVARLDSALKLLEEKERHNQMLQSKLLVAYDEMTKLSATAAAFQERSLNLAHEVQKLQGELKMLEAPRRGRPWWKFWG